MMDYARSRKMPVQYELEDLQLHGVRFQRQDK